MAFIPFNQVVEMVLIQSMLGQSINNVLTFEMPDVPDTIDLTDMASAAITSWITNLATELSFDLDLNSVKCTSLESASAPSVIIPAPAGTDGVYEGAALPLNVAIVVSERTDSRGRSYRGRYYQAGLPYAVRDSVGSISPSALAALLAGYTDFIEEIEAETGATHVIASRYADGVARTLGVATPVVSYSGNVDFDSQRRRLIGRGA